MIERLTPRMVQALIRDGYRRLEPARKQRRQNWELFLTRHHTSEPTKIGTKVVEPDGRWQPLNFLAQAGRTLLTALAFKQGDPVITPKYNSDLEFSGRVMEAHIEETMSRLQARELYQSAILDAFLGGITFTKTGVQASPTIFQDDPGAGDNGEGIDPGQEYIKLFGLDDYVIDPAARDRSGARFEGVKFRVNRKDAMELGLYGIDPGEQPINPNVATKEEAVEILRAASKTQNKSRAGTRVSDITMNAGNDSQDDEEMVELWELEWRDNGRYYTIITTADPNNEQNASGSDTKFLAIQPITLTSDGSIDALSFLPDMENVIPVGLAELQKDLALVADMMANKLIRRALRMKNVTVYGSDGEETVDRLKNAPDQSYVRGNPGALTTINQDTPLSPLIEGVMHFTEQWNNVSGNLQLAGGQNDIGKTATAFQGLLGRVEGWMNYLSERVEGFSGRHIEKLAQIAFKNPLLQGQMPVKITDQWTVPVAYGPEQLEGRSIDYNYTIRSGSMGFVDPVIEGNQIIQLFAQGFPAIAAMVQAGVLKPSTFRTVARKFRMPELEDCLNDPQLDMMRQAISALGPNPQQQQPQRSTPQGVQGFDRSIDAGMSARQQMQPMM